MINESKIISFIINFGDELENAFRHSVFLKLCRRIVMIWNNSAFGKIISGFFDLEVYKNSIFYKLINSAFMALIKITVKKIPLKVANENSRYISIIRNIFSKISFSKEMRIKNILKNSFFINSIYEFWLSVD